MEARLVDPSAIEDVDDDVLAKRADSDLDAFGELYQRYLCPVYRFIRSQVPTDGIAEDLTAQVFFRALRSAGTFKGQSSYSGWIFRIAHNCISTWRRSKERSIVTLEDIPEHPDGAPSPASQFLRGEARSTVWKTVAKLSPSQREVIALRYLREFSIEEIAEITGRSGGAVRVLLHRARLKLRSALEGKDLR